jgi:hypothetical protein
VAEKVRHNENEKGDEKIYGSPGIQKEKPTPREEK